MTRTFDPATETQKLRDHLASHDKPIVFLFGAGTSAAVKASDKKPLVPAVSEMTKRVSKAVAAKGGKFGKAWDLIIESLDEDRRTIEDVLSAVRGMCAAVLPGDKLAGLTKAELAQLESTIQEAIASEVRPSSTRIPDVLPHHSLGRWLSRADRSLPVEIFTLNYDTLIERALEDEWVPVFDGFVGSRRPYFSASSLTREAMAPGRRWTRLWKLHGSVNWSLEVAGDGSQRFVRGEEQASGELILPSSHKYDESRKQPYVAMVDRLRRVLSEREDTVLITSGYSFGDQHVNEVIFESLDANPRLHVFALCFEDSAVDGDLAATAARRTNLLVFGPGLAIVGGEQGPWELHNPTTFAPRLLGIFEAKEPTEPISSGELKLGDFKSLCVLLGSIAASNA